MTTAAALEVWSDRNLRQELLTIANSGTSGSAEEFYARSWSVITRSRPGQSSEYYMSRVITQCCRPRWARPHG